jgi:hypothetical protein
MSLFSDLDLLEPYRKSLTSLKPIPEQSRNTTAYTTKISDVQSTEFVTIPISEFFKVNAGNNSSNILHKLLKFDADFNVELPALTILSLLDMDKTSIGLNIIYGQAPIEAIDFSACGQDYNLSELYMELPMNVILPQLSDHLPNSASTGISHWAETSDFLPEEDIFVEDIISAEEISDEIAEIKRLDMQEVDQWVDKTQH